MRAFGKFVLLLIAGSAFAQEPRYLAFQIFTDGSNSGELQRNFPPAGDLRTTVRGLADRIGVQGSGNRKLAFVVGPLSFDQTDQEVRARIGGAFDVALATGVAVGFHVDDSMFWGRRKELNTSDSIEWLDWNRTPNTGRRLDWSDTPAKVMPQLCFNSPLVKAAVARRASLIGGEVASGVRKLAAEGRGDLFLGVIAGWETRIGRDFDTGKDTGFCALTQAGFSASKPPADREAELAKITREFAGFWARSLVQSGVPEGKVYSHIALSGATPAETAFCDSCVPGLSTYPQRGLLEQWSQELKKHGNPPWASCEGTALDPGEAGHGGKGMDMEGYLGNLFNHGAVMVNIFGWGVGDAANPFRQVAESDNAVVAYRKFLREEELHEAPILEAELPDKIHRIQAALPGWIDTHGAAQVKPLMEKLDAAVKAKRFDDAAKAADEILRLLAQ